MERTTDGFVIAEADLEMRGPGEFLGTKQSGVEIVPFAEVCTIDLVLAAREDAEDVIERDPELSSPENQKIRELVRKDEGVKLAN
jgi:ATP-dependent DNA helicase RecG